MRLTLTENGRQVTKVVSLAFGAGVHPALMAPTAITGLAVLAGIFIILDSRTADQRLVLAGERPGPLLASRLGLIALAALLATGVSLAVTAAVASIGQWGSFIAANVLLAVTYAMIGVILAPLFGRVADRAAGAPARRPGPCCTTALAPPPSPRRPEANTLASAPRPAPPKTRTAALRLTRVRAPSSPLVPPGRPAGAFPAIATSLDEMRPR